MVFNRILDRLGLVTFILNQSLIYQKHLYLEVILAPKFIKNRLLLTASS
jgi:hypothetical protein